MQILNYTSEYFHFVFTNSMNRNESGRMYQQHVTTPIVLFDCRKIVFEFHIFQAAACRPKSLSHSPNQAEEREQPFGWE